MRRRAFMANLSSALLLPTLLPKNALGQDPRAGLLNPAHLDPGMDMDPCSGYTTRPEKQFFFTDLRHIDPGDLSWRSIDGKPVPAGRTARAAVRGPGGSGTGSARHPHGRPKGDQGGPLASRSAARHDL